MMQHRISKLFLVGLINGLIVAFLFYGFETYLYYTDPFLGLPFDSFYYKNNRIYYPNLTPPPLPSGAERWSWGQVITTNEFGLRERSFQRPKAAQVCRIMVLGDSFTYGIGLAWHERFTHLVEQQLNQTFPQHRFEVINVGRSGAPTVSEVAEAYHLHELLQPDLFVLGFVTNDPQPKNQDYRREKELFDKQYGAMIKSGLTTLARVGLPQTAQTTQQALNNMLVSAQIIPPWEVGLQRTYEPDSVEWRNFTQALQDLKKLSADLALPPPIFMVLNQDNYDLQNPPIYLRWARQAEQAAAEIGLRHFNYETELGQLPPERIPLNALDSHPSAQVNQIYAQKLATLLATDFQAGQLCAKPQGAVAITPTPLAAKKLLSVKFGTQLRFWGYVMTQPLRLNLGWQTLGEITASYRLKLSLLDSSGHPLLEQETIPCEGKCPTSLWPSGVIAPPGATRLYWPEQGQLHPKPFSETTALPDNHTLQLPANWPQGRYTLTLTVLDQGTPLPAYDEIGQTPLSSVILGTITTP